MARRNRSSCSGPLRDGPIQAEIGFQKPNWNPLWSLESDLACCAGRREERRRRFASSFSPSSKSQPRGEHAGGRDEEEEEDGEVLQGLGHGARQVPQRDRLRQGAEEAVQGVRGGEGAQHHQRVRGPEGDLLQLQEGPG